PNITAPGVWIAQPRAGQARIAGPRGDSAAMKAHITPLLPQLGGRLEQRGHSCSQCHQPPKRGGVGVPGVRYGGSGAEDRCEIWNPLFPNRSFANFALGLLGPWPCKAGRVASIRTFHLPSPSPVLWFCNCLPARALTTSENGEKTGGCWSAPTQGD
ncbi:unnamed protein product, partial [Phaeothamnion confervicola]